MSGMITRRESRRFRRCHPRDSIRKETGSEDQTMSEAKIACSACRTRLRASDIPSEGASPPLSPMRGADRGRCPGLRPVRVGLIAVFALARVPRRGRRMGGRHPGPPRARQPGSGRGAGSRGAVRPPARRGGRTLPPQNPRPRPSSSGKVASAPAEVDRESPRTALKSPSNGGEDRQHAGTIVRASLGRELFLREWMPDDSRSHGGDGLGPVFNDSSCVACHNLGGVGGGGPNGKNVDILSTSTSDRDETPSPRAAGGRAGGAKDDAVGEDPPRLPHRDERRPAPLRDLPGVRRLAARPAGPPWGRRRGGRGQETPGRSPRGHGEAGHRAVAAAVGTVGLRGHPGDRACA